MSARLPASLAQALASRLDGVPLKALREGYAELSRDYRARTVSPAERADLDGGAGPAAGRLPGGLGRAEARRLAYLAARLPATYAAAQAALAQLPDAALAEVSSALDLGAGPGTASWALAERWPGLKRAQLLEGDPSMLRHAQALGAAFPALEVQAQAGDLDAGLAAAAPADLVLLAYVLSETGEGSQAQLLDSAWARARRGLLIVEPGTPETARRLQAARTHLAALGGRLLGPCPQAGPCPLEQGPAWCHFSVRLERRGLHKDVKGGELGYEDEKFGWLYFAKGPLGAEPAPYRLHSDPKRAKRNIHLDVCGADGQRRELYYDRRKTPAHLRQAARRLRWGDAWDPQRLPPPPEQAGEAEDAD